MKCLCKKLLQRVKYLSLNGPGGRSVSKSVSLLVGKARLAGRMESSSSSTSNTPTLSSYVLLIFFHLSCTSPSHRVHSVSRFGKEEGKVELNYEYICRFSSQQSFIQTDVSNTLFSPHSKHQQVMHEHIFILFGLPLCKSFYDKGFKQNKTDKKSSLFIFQTAKMGSFQT